VRLELRDLLFEAQPMRPVLRCIDRFAFQSSVLGAQSVDFLTQSIVLSFDVFPFGHVPILARCKPSAATRLGFAAQPG